MTRSGRGGRSYFPLAQLLEYQKNNHVFDDVIGADDDDVLYRTAEGTEQYQGAWVTVNTFQFLGVAPLVGQGIVPDDVMAYKRWNKRFALDTSILGRSFLLNGTPTTLVGSCRRDSPSGQRLFQARMKPGVTLKDVEADITVVARRLAQVYPKDYPKSSWCRRTVMWTVSSGNSRRRCSPWLRRWDCCC